MIRTGIDQKRGIGRRRLRAQLDQGRPLRLKVQTTSAATLLAEIERVAKKLGKAG